MSDLAGRLWAKGFCPNVGEPWTTGDQANVRALRDEIEVLRRVAYYAKQVQNGGGPGSSLGLDQALEDYEALSTKDTAQDPGFYDPRLPRFYAESRCSQCGHPEEHIKRTGCPEKCGREPLVVKERAQTDAWPRRPDGRCAFCGAPPGEPHKFRCTPSLARAALEKGNG